MQYKKGIAWAAISLFTLNFFYFLFWVSFYHFVCKPKQGIVWNLNPFWSSFNSLYAIKAYLPVTRYALITQGLKFEIFNQESMP